MTTWLIVSYHSCSTRKLTFWYRTMKDDCTALTKAITSISCIPIPRILLSYLVFNFRSHWKAKQSLYLFIHSCMFFPKNKHFTCVMLSHLITTMLFNAADTTKTFDTRKHDRLTNYLYRKWNWGII